MAGRPDRCADDDELRALRAAIVESSVDAVTAVTLDGIVTSWNVGAEAMYGYTAEEMTGRHVSVVYPPDRTEELAPILDQIRRGRRVHDYETRRVRKDGTVIDVSISTSPVRDRSGAIVGAAGVSRDITERNWVEGEHRADEARRREAERMEAERMEAEARIAGGIAREFSGLLSAIMGYTASVADATAGDGRVTKQPDQGMGLGLSVVYGIVTKVGGAVTIDSEEGRGTAFHIYLPAAHVPAQASAPGRSPGAGQRILVVDDQPAVAEIASRILHHNGYRALQASSYEEALSLLSAHHPDLLLTDRMLAALPTQPLADRARKLSPGIRVLYMSRSPASAPGPGGGQIQVIGKPFTPQDLLEKVRATLAATTEY